jgi:DNA processing protein
MSNTLSTVRRLTASSLSFPEALRNIPTPPQQLYCRGAPLNDLLQRPRVAIVGSRGISAYGRRVTTELAGKLAERGIVIISGLALGVDAAAHRAALDAGGLTIAILPGPVDKIYPASNIRLGEEILAKGGTLVSEYATEEYSFKQNFIARNRLVAGLAQAVLITEAAKKSGSRHTVDFALEQGKDVLAAPGNITSPTSVGANSLIKSGATPVTSYADVLHALGLRDRAVDAKRVHGRNRHEQLVLDLLLKGLADGEQLLKQSGLAASEFNQTLTMLELGGKIRPLGSNQWSIH